MTAGCRRIGDFYAGLGTFTFPLAQTGAEVLAVEGDGALLAALGQAAGRSPLSRLIRTQRRDLARDPPSAAELGRFDAVVFDPPRAGARALAASLAAAGVERVVAVSCEPATFARDARIVQGGGYRLERLVPVDQFLWSPRLELVASFRR